MTIRVLRTTYKVPLDKIRQAVRMAQEKDIVHPLATKNTLFVLGVDLYFQDNASPEPEPPIIQASGKYRRQPMLREVVRPFIKDICWNAVGEPETYQPLADGERRILLNRRVRFGQPLVLPCGYTATTLAEAVDVEGTIERAAEVYGVEPADIEFACKYRDSLILPRTA